HCFQVWRHLVLVGRLLCQLSHTPHSLHMLRMAIRHFLLGLEDICGKGSITINFHLLMHMPEAVEQLGPLPTSWTFSGERYIGLLQMVPNNKKSVEKQLMAFQLRYR